MNIYLANCENFNNNGLGFLKDCLSANVTHEINGIYELNFEYPLNTNMIDYLIEDNIVKCNVGNDNYQLFRIKHIQKTFKTIKVNAPHIFYDLSSNFIEDCAPTKLTADVFGNWILDRTTINNKFRFSTNLADVKSARYVRRNPVECIMGNIDNSMLSLFNAEIIRNNFDINIVDRIGNDNNVKLSIGKNIKEINISIDSSSIFTKVMPVGYDGLLLPEKYVDSPLIDNYIFPKICKYNFDNIKYDETADDAYHTLDEAYEAMINATNDLYEKGLDKPTINVKINWLELSKTREYYEKYHYLEKIELGDTVHADLLGLTYTARITKTIYNVLTDKIDSFEVGSTKNTINTTLNLVRDEIVKSNPNDILIKAKEDATKLITSAMGGFIYKTQNELFIMDTNNLNTAQKVWRWNLNGLGYSNNGINGPYEIAITQDGKIVADFITTGKLNTDVIEGYNELLLNVSKINNQIIPTSQVSGSYIHVEDSADVPLINLEIEGKSEQETRSGKNMLNVEEELLFTRSKTINVNLPAGTYHITCKSVSSDDETFKPTIRINDNNIIRLLSDNCNISVTLTQAESTIYLYSKTDYPTSAGISCAINQLMISADGGDYEQYGASPSPDYPSEIRSVGYENLYDEKLIPENYYYNANGVKTNHSYKFINKKITDIDENMTISFKEILGAGASNGYVRFFEFDINDTFIKRTLINSNKTVTLEENTNYVIVSVDADENNAYFEELLITKGTKIHKYITFGKYGIEFEVTGKNLCNGISQGFYLNAAVTQCGVTSSDTGLVIPINGEKNFTISSKISQVRYRVACIDTIPVGDLPITAYNGINKDGTSESITIDTSNYTYLVVNATDLTQIQVEIGSKVTEIEEYKSTKIQFVLDEPLRSLPDGTKDVSYIQNGKIYLERHIIDLTLNGTENMLAGQYGTNAYKITPALMPNNDRAKCEVMSNTFLGVSHADRANYKSNYIYVDGRDLYFRNTDFDSIDDFRTYLSENNVKVQYKLATILVKTEELGEIEMPSTFKGVSNIATTDELEPIINLEYVRNTTLSSYVEGQVNNSQVIIRNEMNAKFVLQQENIDLELSKKVNNKEIIAAINMSTESLDDGSNLQIKADKIDLKGKKIDLTSDEITIESDNFSVTKEGKVTAKSGEIGGFTLEPDKFTAKISTTYTFTLDDLNKVMAYIQDEETLSDEELEKYDINGDGVVDKLDLLAMNRMYYEYISNVITGLLEINSTQTQRTFVLRDENGKIKTSVGLNGIVTPNHSCEHFTLNGIEQPQIQSGTNLPETVTDGVVFLLYSE